MQTAQLHYLTVTVIYSMLLRDSMIPWPKDIVSCLIYIWIALDSPLFLSVLSLINLQVLKETTGRQHWSTFQINDGESNLFFPTLSSVNSLHTGSTFLQYVFLLLHLFPSSLCVLQWFLRCSSVTHQSGRFTQTVSQPRNATESHLNPCKLQAVNPALTIRAVKQHFEGQAHPLSSRCCISELHDLLLNLPLYNLPDS